MTVQSFEEVLAKSLRYPQVARRVRSLFSVKPLIITTPEQQILKAIEELAELQFAIDGNLASGVPTETEVLEEFADVLVCLVGCAYKLGIQWQDLVTALDAKLKVNLTRTWTRQPDGTYQHD